MDLNLIQQENDILQKLEKAATPSEWHHGPNTCAGSVWVYAKSSPLLEPTHYILKMFRLRSDSQLEWKRDETKEAKEDRFWKQKQADVNFIIYVRNKISQYCVNISLLINKVKKLQKENKRLKNLLKKHLNISKDFDDDRFSID